MSLTTLLIAILAATGVDGSESGDARLKLLDFHTPRCAPCLAMRSEIAQLVDAGYPIRSVYCRQDEPDADEAKTAQRYNVTKFPTFIVVDPQGRELSRVIGFQPAAQLARHYNETCRSWKAEQAASRSAEAGQDEAAAKDADAEATAESEQAQGGSIKRVSTGDDDAESTDPDNSSIESPAAANLKPPKPWETVVRIEVHDNNKIGYGSGTIIYSDAQRSLILTCAHIFKLDAPLPPNPARFPRRVSVDLFDGRLHGLKPAQVHKLRSVEAKVLDYDFVTDVGLIEIRPGKKLAASPVVGPDWRPRKGLAMDTVGCSHGHDATAWTTEITSPQYRARIEGRIFEGTACRYSPKIGRSGGGLFTRDGYLAGVCDFATDDDHGLYAAPQSIHKLLDRNQLTALYLPDANSVDQDRTLLADDRDNRSGDRTVRGQSPDSADRRSPVRVALPDPDRMGIRSPSRLNRDLAESKSAWRSMAPEPADPLDQELRGSRRNPIAARINMDPSVRDERIEPASPAPSTSSRKPAATSSAAKSKPTPGVGTKSNWQSAEEPFPEFSGAR